MLFTLLSEKKRNIDTKARSLLDAFDPSASQLSSFIFLVIDFEVLEHAGILLNIAVIKAFHTWFTVWNHHYPEEALDLKRVTTLTFFTGHLTITIRWHLLGQL